MPSNLVFFFGNGKAEGDPKKRELLGGKGSGLAEMTQLSIPVPPGFTISSEVCTYYYQNKYTYPSGFEKEVLRKLKQVEESMGSFFGDPKNPLLVSVRSGSRVSMPGMMDTVLNLGLNDHTLQGLIQETQKERFAYDSYRRFIQMYSNVVLGMDLHLFKAIEDFDLQVSDLKEIVAEYKAVVRKQLEIG